MKKTGFGMMAACLLACGICNAEPGVAPSSREGTVPQREMPVNIWGKADPGEKMSVSFAVQKKTAVTDSSNPWKIVFDPMSASSEPRKLEVLLVRKKSGV